MAPGRRRDARCDAVRDAKLLEPRVTRSSAVLRE
jgi:hypothetical protein